MPGTIWSAQRLGNPPQKEPEVGRSAFQQDYDRLLFSTPVRRLSDKTQVWPMDENDGVRTRLTHSHEVANLARSIGTRVFHKVSDLFDGANLYETVLPILSAICLAHDLGNPPFGHQGEVAIGTWFKNREEWIFTQSEPGGGKLEQSVADTLRGEFLAFDGNPQTLRLLSKLQISVANVGLDLTAATLAASIKYPVRAGNQDKNRPAIKKIGYFESERTLVEWIRQETGLEEGQRHPLTWIMETCDDIAYSVLDVDDAMKKKAISPDDVVAILESKALSELVAEIKVSFEKTRKLGGHAEIVRDIKIDYLRAHFFKALIADATTNFVTAAHHIFSYSHEEPLLDKNLLWRALTDIARQYAFQNPIVLRTETIGAAALDNILSCFWNAIYEREKPADLRSKRRTAFGNYTFSLMSQNYLENAVRAADAKDHARGMRYRELRLLTDMISGMTDNYSVRLSNDLRAMK